MQLYISSTESAEFYTPRKIVNHRILEKKGWFSSNFFLHIETEESVSLSGLDNYGINQKLGANFIISSRYIRKNIADLTNFPITVNIFIPKNNNFDDVKNNSNLIFYAIAELYDNIDDAKRHIIK